MPNVNNVITRSDIGDTGIIPVQYANEIIKNAPKSSVLLTRGRHVAMTSKQRKQPVLNLFPAAYWVDGDTGLKQTSKAQWKGLTMTAEEIAVIIPVPEAIIEDSAIDLWAEITPAVAESFGKLIDQAGIFGTGKPESWPEAIVPGAIAANNAIEFGTGVDLADDIAAMGETLAEQGYGMNGFASQPGLNWKLRRLRSTDNEPIYQQVLAETGTTGLYGLPLNEVDNGAWDKTKAMIMGADWNNFLVGIRKDMTYKWLDQAVISDADGKVMLNLAQQDCMALRVVCRVGFAVANPVNGVEPDGTKRFPAAVITPKGGANYADADVNGDGTITEAELNAMTVEALKAYATEKGVDLSGKTTKANIVATILAA